MAQGKAVDKADRAGAKPSYPITSVGNALRLLLMFRDHKRLRLTDVAHSLDVADSTAHRLLAMLIQHDFVRREEDLRVYVAGPALLEIGLAAVRNLDIRNLARPILADLALRVNETVHLAQLEGGRIRYLAGAESNRALRVADRTGQLMPAHRTATGKALLAELTAAQLDELFASETPGALRPEERGALDAELSRVRDQGYATNHRDADEDEIVSVATVVRDRRDLAVAALNASAPATRMPRKRQLTVVRHLHAAASQLETLLNNAVG
ncbi:IclR family transcriptional regulator [Streptomyces sulfonofaciens]|uniref:IclR family transcriptional regulator n=1 Tax=Streptomyces sulfonofaciens TaxID=68272 RepID=A0A919L293_9ACTN|nr:IclR family transcriptional regulator [Streptomyces sulfonofaciens]GHH81253.1 IclR family transcriptional regulator [Streptomyces sulfonofaciens]